MRRRRRPDPSSRRPTVPSRSTRALVMLALAPTSRLALVVLHDRGICRPRQPLSSRATDAPTSTTESLVARDRGMGSADRGPRRLRRDTGAADRGCPHAYGRPRVVDRVRARPFRRAHDPRAMGGCDRQTARRAAISMERGGPAAFLRQRSSRRRVLDCLEPVKPDRDASGRHALAHVEARSTVLGGGTGNAPARLPWDAIVRENSPAKWLSCSGAEETMRDV